MRKHIIFFVLVVLVFIAFSQSVYAEESNVILFIPEKMIVGETYQGMITLLSPSQSNSLILLSVDDDFVLEIDSSVNIQTNKNHGIFTLTPLNEGEAIISILYDGELLSANTKVYSKKSDAQKLKVVLPVNSTVSTNMKGMVFLLDGNDSPIQSTFDRIISLTATEKIFTPNSVTIQNGSSYAIFSTQIRATGEITAIAPQLKSHTISIEKSQEIIDVKIGIAPSIILEESYTNYFIWLEKDDKPYTIQGVQKIEIQSSNTDVVRLGLSPASYKNQNSIIISMYDGMSKGRLYTGDSGIAEIFVSIDNYGSASSIVYVGATLLDNDEDESLSIEDYTDYDDSDINYITLQVYPNITDDYSYGVASLYHAEQTEEIEITVDDDGVQISNEIVQTVLIPVKTEDVLISISSENGIQHDSSYLLDDVSFPTHSKVFEITANSIGNYTITATGGNSYDMANLLVTTDHNSLYSINLTELPILSHNSQPLLMVSIVNEDDKLVDVSELFGEIISVNVYSTNGILSSSTVSFENNVGIIYGVYTGAGTISVSSDYGISTQNIIPSGVATSMEFFTPDIIHSAEPFPIIIHEIDAKGTPLLKKDASMVSSSGFDVVEDSNYDGITVNNIGKQNISILSSLGGGFSKILESFVNEIDYTIHVDNYTPRIGETITIKIDSPINNVTYDIDSPFPYDMINSNTFEITPDHQLDGVITITGKLDGFGISSKQVSISPVNLVEISVDANTIHGDIISPKYTIKLQDDSSTYHTPHNITIPPQPVVLEMAKDLKTVTSGYKLVELSINGKIVNGNVIEFYADSDYIITAIYDKFVSISVNNGEGSGIYSYGDSVLISAPDKPVLSFLVKETFDYWEGTNRPSSFLIIAEKDITFTAMYKDDYYTLMGVIFAGIIGVVLFVIKNGDSAIRYRIEEITEKITPVIKKLTPNLKKPKISIGKK